MNSTVMNCFYIFLLLLLKVDKSSCKLYGCKNVSIYFYTKGEKKSRTRVKVFKFRVQVLNF